MKTMLYRTVAVAALIMPSMAFAQSTGSIETEEEAIVVTGTRNNDGVNGVVVPDSVKARGVLTQKALDTQNPGQSILNSVNLLPGVNFTNSDAYGSSGGNIRIRGFDGNRVSLTFDGFPLNDSGNYAIYSNQQLDPELIEQVNVNLGTTDIDSPTAAAAGGTINYRTIVPSKTLSAQLKASYGTDEYFRVFGIIQPGELTSFGTRLFASASMARNDKFKGPGRIQKQQYNARIYQPIGDNGDFVSLAGHYNQNRNNFYRNPSVSDMRSAALLGTAVPAASAISSSAPVVLKPTDAQWNALYAFENDRTCNYGTGSSIQTTCTSFYGVRINPSNTGNARFNSKFTLADNLVFTLDGSYQYVLANGGGYTTQSETSTLARGSKTTGVDWNKDGDTADTLGFYTPNTTNTRRWTAMASLIWDLNDTNRFRLAYTFDRARHRQTGEWTYLDRNGFPLNVFGGRNGPDVLNADGYALRQRDRLSIALLNQISGQYIGKFIDEKLRVELGLRMPFFKRELNNYCYTPAAGSGFPICTSQPASALVIIPATANAPYPANAVYAPFKANYKFDKMLPSAGINYEMTDDLSLFASYSKGISMPRTDNLYRRPIVEITPETTNAFDGGLRYNSSRVQAMLSGWYIGYNNRIVTSFDADAGISIDRNVGKVDGYGADANLAYEITDNLSAYLWGSYNRTKFKQNIELGTGCKVALVAGACPTGQTGTIYAPTSGKYMAETPEWTLGARGEVNVGPVRFGAQAKYTGSRYATDVNDVKVPSYTLVDLDAKLSFKDWGLDRTAIYVNVNNLFDKQYFGNLSTQINAGNICPTGWVCSANSANPNFSLGAPRTITATLAIGF